MSFDQAMEDSLVVKVLDGEKSPCRHSGVGSSFADSLTHNDDNDIEVEEIADADFEQGTDIKVLKPDEYEEPPDLCLQESDPDSRTSTPPDPTAQHEYLIQGLRSLHCDDSDTKEGSQTWLWNSKHQWMMGTRKRSHSQSAGNDTQSRHTEPLGVHDLGDIARRLRRRVRRRSNQSRTALGRTPPVNTIEIEEADDDVRVQPTTLHASNGTLEAEAVDELGDVMDVD